MTCPRCEEGPLDLAAVADLLGVLPNSVSRQLLRQAFPPPDGHVGRSPWWWRDTLAAWGMLGTTKRPALASKGQSGALG